MKRLILIIVLCVVSFPLAGFSTTTPKWSVVIYAGTDEEDLFHHAEPLLQKLIDEQVIPAGVELLIEQDTYGLRPMRRVIKKGKVASITYLPEADSAGPQTFSSFLNWAKLNKHGTHTLLLLATHSWGWKGIIQDFNIPGLPDTDTMMPVRVFAQTLKDSNLSPEVVMFDSCVTGNADFIDEFSGSTPYLVASQRETPYGGLPFGPLFKLLSSKPSPRTLAKSIPEMYVRAYTRGGEMSISEGEYDVVTTVSIDMKKWDTFVPSFKELVNRLRESQFRETLQTTPNKFSAFTDGDFNIDLIEFLKRINAQSLLSTLIYNQTEATDSVLTLSPGNFQVFIEGDEILSADVTPVEFLEASQKRFLDMNKDLVLSPNDLVFNSNTYHGKLFVEISGTTASPMSIRPWLPGSKEVKIVQNGKKRTYKRNRDYISTRDYPNESFLLASANTHGAPFIHGIGLNINPLMDENEDRGEDSITGLKGPYYYAMTSWNKRTGWGDLIHLNR